MKSIIPIKLTQNKQVIVDNNWIATTDFVLNTKIVQPEFKDTVVPILDSNKTFQKLHAQSATWVRKAYLSPFRYNNYVIFESTTGGCALVDKNLIKLFCHFSKLEFITDRSWVKILQRGETLGFVKCAPFLLKERKKSYDFWSDLHRFKLNV